MTTSKRNLLPSNYKSHNSPYPPPISSAPFQQSTFNTDHFLLGGGIPSLSQPRQPALPAIQTTLTGTKRPYSPSLLPIERPSLVQSHSPAMSVLSPHSSTTNNNCYNRPHAHAVNGQNSYSTTGSSHFSPGAHSLFSGNSGSPGVDMPDVYPDGYTENTTPEFEDVPMPPLADDDVYIVDDPVDPILSFIVSGAYPPSPRATSSPSPKGQMVTSLGLPAEGRLRGSPVVKVEQFTPAHSTNSEKCNEITNNKQQTNGENGVGLNMHPTPLSFNNGSISTSSDPSLNVTARQSDIRRDENGAWRGGLDPTLRNSGELIFNLTEQSFHQAREIKNAEIQDWLRKHPTVHRKDGRSISTSGGLMVKDPRKRRAKSVSDFKSNQHLLNTPPAPLSEIYISEFGRAFQIDDCDVDSSSDEDSSVATSFDDGSLDDALDDDESMNTSETPPTEEDLRKSELEAAEEEQRRLENDPDLLPSQRRFYSQHPWNDSISAIARGAELSMHQPRTANAAIMKFSMYSQNIDTASRVATFGSQASRSRRLSAGDADKTLVESGLLKRLSFGKDKDKDKEPGHQRRSSMWGNMVKNGLKRGFSNAGDKDKSKEKEPRNNEPNSGNGEIPTRKRGDSTASSIASTIASVTPFGPPKPSRSWSKGPLRVDTTVSSFHSVPSAFVQIATIGAGIGKSSGHTTNKPSSPAPAPEKKGSGPWPRGAKLKGSKPASGIVGLLGQYGGPPALPIKSPVVSGNSSGGEKLRPSFTFGEESSQRGIADARKHLAPPDPHRHDGYDDDDDDMDGDVDVDENQVSPVTNIPGASTTGTKLLRLSITPSIEGFTAHVKERTPGLDPKLVERIVYEQGKRYKKLVDHRQKHLAAIKNGRRCGNDKNCRGQVGAIGSGGQEDGYKMNPSGGYEGEVYSSDETVGDHSPTEGKVAAAQFPTGVPQPPVLRLPAEFECPICFKVKKFTKPSDWTKHVHEDVHPFTCTFTECNEPKSFKRKADWVRHENERHRHLEWWDCNIPDCTHTCYRKDNFVQHLVREHKMAEPKPKAQKAAARAGKAGKRGKNKAAVGGDGVPTSEDVERVWQIVDKCHKTTKKHPTEEKCRFCGAVCQTWKKLTVHLARHMETISLPVLDLISDDSVVPPSSKPSNGRASRPDCAPMPKVQRLATNMEIDFGNGMPQQQQQQPVGRGYGGGNSIPQSTYHTQGFSHLQQTPPRISPHMPPDHQFGIQTSPNMSPYPMGSSGIMTPMTLGYSPDVRTGLPSQQFDMYPSPAPTTQSRAPAGYSPSSTYSHHSPSQSMMPGLPGQHLHIQQQTPYFVYGEASGQVHGSIGAGVGQVHSQVVETAHNLAHGLIENNNGQYPLYAGGTEIPMEMMEVVEMSGLIDDQYLGMRYMHR